MKKRNLTDAYYRDFELDRRIYKLRKIFENSDAEVKNKNGVVEIKIKGVLRD